MVDVRDRKNNVRIRRIVKTKKDAQALEARIRQDLNQQKVPDAGIEKALENYIQGESKTLKDQDSMLSKARGIRPYIRGKTFSDLGQVQDTIKKSMLDQGLKPATINRRLALLRRLANLAYDWGWIAQPLGKKIKLLPGEVARHYYLTPDQVEALASRSPLTGSLIRIAAYTGLRRGELFKIQKGDIKADFIVLDADTKTRQPRLVPIPDAIRSDLEAYAWPLDPAFDWELRKEFEAARQALGLSHIRFHDLRHTYASLLAQAGATLQMIGRAMGHSTPVMTHRYAHLVEDNLKDLAAKFGAILGATEK